MSKSKNFFQCLFVLGLFVAIEVIFGGQRAASGPGLTFVMITLLLRLLVFGFILVRIAKAYPVASLAQKLSVFLLLVSLEQVPLKWVALKMDQRINGEHWAVIPSGMDLFAGLLLGFASEAPILLLFGFAGFSLLARRKPKHSF